MRWSVRHYFDFGEKASAVGGDLQSRGAWEAVRAGSDAFSVPASREAWLHACELVAGAEAKGRDLAVLARRLGVASVFSAGSGLAAVEYFFKRECPGVRLTCSDFTVGAIERLRTVFDECEQVVTFDMKRDSWPDGHDLYLLHRVDTEFRDREWRSTFGRMSRSARRVLFVPSGYLTVQVWLRQRAKRVLARARGRRLTASGWIRNREAMEALWAGSYEIVERPALGGQPAYLLETRH